MGKSTPGEHMIRFLLIEDDEDHAAIVIRSLKRARVLNELDWVADGVEGLKFLRKEGKYQDMETPDVVLLDLKLPKKDGHEVLEEIKQDPALQSLPVVVLTTSDAERDIAQAYQHHANSYIVKPLDFKKFCQLADELSLYWGVWNRPAPVSQGAS